MHDTITSGITAEAQKKSNVIAYFEGVGLCFYVGLGAGPRRAAGGEFFLTDETRGGFKVAKRVKTFCSDVLVSVVRPEFRAKLIETYARGTPVDMEEVDQFAALLRSGEKDE